MLYAQRAFPQTLSDSGVRHGCFPATAGAFRSKPQTSSLAHSGARPHLLKVLQNAFQQILANSGTLPNACPQTLAFRNKPKVLSSQALADSRPAHEPCIGIYKRSRLPEQNETPHPPRLLTFRAQQAAGRLWWRIQRITAKWREIVWHDMHRGRPFPPRSKIRLTASFERVVRSSTRLSAGIPPMPSFCDRVPFLGARRRKPQIVTAAHRAKFRRPALPRHIACAERVQTREVRAVCVLGFTKDRADEMDRTGT